MTKPDDERDLRAQQALAIWAEAITEPATRERFGEDPRRAMEEALAKFDRSLRDLPDDVVDFFAGLSLEELQTLANLQTTMVAVREQGFTSLSDTVLLDQIFTLCKL